MPEELTPEKYFAMLRAEGAIPDVEAPSYEPGQTLRSMLTDEELQGLRAFIRRTGGPAEAEALERELDLDLAVATTAVVPETSAQLVADASRAAVSDPRSWVKVAAFAALVCCLALGVAVAVDRWGGEAAEDEYTRSLEDASGPRLLRGREAQALLTQFSVPPEWRASPTPRVSMTGDEESSWASYEQTWDLPPSWTVKRFRSWFKDQPAVRQPAVRASCTSELGARSAQCEADFAPVDDSGEIDYDRPRRFASFDFSAAGGAGDTASITGEFSSLLS